MEAQEQAPDYRRINNKFIRSSVEIEKTVNISGSTAGAGSGDFHRYRIQRRKEKYRMAKMEFDAKQKELEEEEEKVKAEKKKALEERSNKKAEKRMKKKQKLKELKNAKKMNAFANDGSFLASFLKDKETNAEKEQKVENVVPDADAVEKEVEPETKIEEQKANLQVNRIIFFQSLYINMHTSRSQVDDINIHKQIATLKNK
eukprot:TRINITY_DN1882_c0_g1_i1.p4 TRINITY_DN1882_c0_g1~~TRINITY_DN1882_c0_g1_i1.p4  ORF type:complete len:202 (+),score=51.56 TRINITY_DN1882_c0_g1_i1:1723-2328(+)